MYEASVLSPTVLVFGACLLMCFSILLLARHGVAELKMRLDRLEQGKTRLPAIAKLLKPKKKNCTETEQPLSPPWTQKMRIREALRKPLMPDLTLLEIGRAQTMHHQVA